MNISYNPLEYATYNTGCASEFEKYAKFCTDFKVDVISQVSNRFKIALIITFILFTFIIYCKYSKPKFTQTEIWKTYIESRLDFFTVMIFMITIALMFI